MEDGENKMRYEKSINVNGVILRITVSVVTMVLLLWAIYSGYELATDPTRYVGYTNWAIGFGIVTMLLGFMFLLLGIPILADLLVNFSDQLQQEAGFHKEWETQKLSKAIAGICAIVMTAMIVWWAIYPGFRLATQSTNVGTYLFLTTSIGIITILLGLIYFIIGLSIIAKLGLDLFNHLPHKKQKRILQLSWSRI